MLFTNPIFILFLTNIQFLFSIVIFSIHVRFHRVKNKKKFQFTINNHTQHSIIKIKRVFLSPFCLTKHSLSLSLGSFTQRREKAPKTLSPPAPPSPILSLSSPSHIYIYIDIHLLFFRFSVFNSLIRFSIGY